MDSNEPRTLFQQAPGGRPAFGAELGARGFVVVVSGRSFGRLRVIGRSAVKLGRGSSCQLRVSDPAVSTVHCRVAGTPGAAHVIEDCGSTNGTFVNGRRIDAPVELRYGDRIRIGSTLLRYYAEEIPERS